MSPFAQQLVVYAVVVLAAAWLGWRWWRPGRREGSCERCGPRPAPTSTRAVRPAALRVLR